MTGFIILEHHNVFTISDAICRAGWQERIPGVCMKVFPDGISWYDAYTYCVDLNTKLFAPDSQKTNLALQELLKEQSTLF